MSYYDKKKRKKVNLNQYPGLFDPYTDHSSLGENRTTRWLRKHPRNVGRENPYIVQQDVSVMPGRQNPEKYELMQHKWLSKKSHQDPFTGQTKRKLKKKRLVREKDEDFPDVKEPEENWYRDPPLATPSPRAPTPPPRPAPTRKVGKAARHTLDPYAKSQIRPFKKSSTGVTGGGVQKRTRKPPFK